MRFASARAGVHLGQTGFVCRSCGFGAMRKEEDSITAAGGREHATVPELRMTGMSTARDPAALESFSCNSRNREPCVNSPPNVDMSRGSDGLIKAPLCWRIKSTTTSVIERYAKSNGSGMPGSVTEVTWNSGPGKASTKANKLCPEVKCETGVRPQSGKMSSNKEQLMSRRSKYTLSQARSAPLACAASGKGEENMPEKDPSAKKALGSACCSSCCWSKEKEKKGCCSSVWSFSNAPRCGLWQTSRLGPLCRLRNCFARQIPTCVERLRSDFELKTLAQYGHASSPTSAILAGTGERGFEGDGARVRGQRARLQHQSERALLMNMDADLGVPWNPWSPEGVDAVVNAVGRRQDGTISLPTGPAFWMQVHANYTDLQTANMVQVGATNLRLYKKNAQVAATLPPSTSIWMQRWKWNITLGSMRNQQDWQRKRLDVVNVRFECDGSACNPGYVVVCFCFVFLPFRFPSRFPLFSCIVDWFCGMIVDFFSFHVCGIFFSWRLLVCGGCCS